MLVHARLPKMYLYHALLHACNVFNILPLKDLVTVDGTVSTPFELFVGSKPMVSHFRVQLIIIKEQQLLHLRKTLFTQTSFHTLLRSPVKRRLLKIQRKPLRRQKSHLLSLRSLMMAWTPALGDPTELGTHQNY